MSRGKSNAVKADPGVSAAWDLVVGLASNPEVYKGTAEDAARLPKLADQISDEFVAFIGNALRRSSDEANSNGL